ncbi:MAG: GTPase ObgE [Ignavibacterium sp.]|jgi:GTP-binding protein|nr:GTPase ObgE [Ignavibacterium sp.]
MFIDFAQIEVSSGKGGDGAVTFRREKYVPKGGPLGGNGGRGGSVIFEAHSNLSTLLDFKYKKKFFAGNGQPGGNSLKDGRNGKDVIIKVPTGTIVKDAETDEIILDLSENGVRKVLFSGGIGGKGNSNFATPTRRTPRFATNGKPGTYAKLVLELKLIADVGLVGFPNAGKSTLISKISAAKPKIADYPFTTLEPNLGIVSYKDFQSFIVADIPGIIEGAHQGKGLGLKFLRHIERTKILLFLIDITSEDYLKDFNTLYNELKKYSKKLVEKQIIVSFSKSDLIPEKEIHKLNKIKFKKIKTPTFIFSSVTGQGLNQLLDVLWETLKHQQ